MAPELPCIISPPDAFKDPRQFIEFAQTRKAEVLDGPWTAYTPEVVAAANQAGVTIWPDIQDRKEGPTYFAAVLARGFTGVQTDHPEELIQWLASKQLR